MITVTILINAAPIFTRSAVRVQTGEPGKPNSYCLDDGSYLDHFGEDGAVQLAIAMLKTIKEPRNRDNYTERFEDDPSIHRL